MRTRQKSSVSKMKEIKTFTYFIPAPPARKNGYREKEFDKIMSGILQSGFELMEIQTQAVSNGLFFLVVLKAPNSKIAKLDQHLDIQDRFKLEDKHSMPEIELDDDDYDA